MLSLSGTSTLWLILLNPKASTVLRCLGDRLLALLRSFILSCDDFFFFAMFHLPIPEGGNLLNIHTANGRFFVWIFELFKPLDRGSGDIHRVITAQ